MQPQIDTRYQDGATHIRPRTVWDSIAGREWRIWAADCRNVPGARGRECLIVDCGTTVRRIWSPPTDWATLSDSELLALVDGPRDR